MDNAEVGLITCGCGGTCGGTVGGIGLRLSVSSQPMPRSKAALPEHVNAEGDHNHFALSHELGTPSPTTNSKDVQQLAFVADQFDKAFE